jgi:hypothetical protein
MRAFTLPAAVLVWCSSVTFAGAQDSPIRLEIVDGLVTLQAQGVPTRQILAEWSRVGNTRIMNGEGVPGGPVTLELTNVPERQALDVLLRGVAGYMAAPRVSGTIGASGFDRIFILPTSAAPRNAAPSAPFPGAAGGRGVPMPIVRVPPLRPDVTALPEDDADEVEEEEEEDDAEEEEEEEEEDEEDAIAPVAAPRVPPAAQTVFPVRPPMMPQPTNTAAPGAGGTGVARPPLSPFAPPPGSSAVPGVIAPVPPPQPRNENEADR